MNCMCKDCYELKEKVDLLVDKDLGSFKLLLILLHWDVTDKNFSEVLTASGFNPSRQWLTIIGRKAEELGLATSNKGCESEK